MVRLSVTNDCIGPSSPSLWEKIKRNSQDNSLLWKPVQGVGIKMANAGN